MFSLQQAARAAGKSKPTLLRAIKAGKLSVGRRDDGSYSIDPAELARAYPLTGDIAGPMKRSGPGNGAGTDPAILPGEVERAPAAPRRARGNNSRSETKARPRGRGAPGDGRGTPPAPRAADRAAPAMVAPVGAVSKRTGRERLCRCCGRPVSVSFRFQPQPV